VLRERGAFLLFSHMPAGAPDLEAYLRQAGVTGRQDNVKVFAELDEAMAWAEDRLLEAQHLDEGALPPLAFREFDLFSGIAASGDIAAIEAATTTRAVAPGELIFGTGDGGDGLFLIRRGGVRIELPVDAERHRTLAWFGRGSFFGEMGFLDNRARTANAVASVPTDLYILRRSSFDDACRKHPLLSGAILGRLAIALAVRLRRTDAELSRLHDA
jgi:SulP family sulfate permease